MKHTTSGDPDTLNVTDEDRRFLADQTRSQATKARAARDAALDYVERAQVLLYQAASVSCDLQGWAEEWDAIGKHADATKKLWHKLNDAPLPTGHDGETPKRSRRCLDENPRTTDR